VRARVLSVGAFALAIVLSAAMPVFAQSPPSPAPAAPLPPPGFVPPYEIVRTARAAGFDSLAPPLREGTTYVLRATDYRGILMRVVIDARSGAIRDANRIVPGPGGYDPGIYGSRLDGPLGMAVPYESPDDRLPPYGPRPDVGAPVTAPSAAAAPPSLVRPPETRRVTHVAMPPLPRPRPAELVARNPAPADVNADAKSAPAVVPTAPNKSRAAVPPIND
jgi:hypothetical protein